ncbi:MAG TPA: acetyl-CoA carboxylase biotin carboxyl carrier protein [Vicinamibacteria bacterium]
MDVRELKEILKILEEQSITEFELEQEGVKLRICRQTSSNHVGAMVSPPSPPLAPAAPASGAPAAAAPAPARPVEVETGETLVKSPIVGTFYRAADPNSPAFVSVGDRVKVGQVLCIVEAMKLMNEIEAEVAGEVVRVHPENGQPVQYGDPLFTVRTDA